LFSVVKHSCPNIAVQPDCAPKKPAEDNRNRLTSMPTTEILLLFSNAVATWKWVELFNKPSATLMWTQFVFIGRILCYTFNFHPPSLAEYFQQFYITSSPAGGLSLRRDLPKYPDWYNLQYTLLSADRTTDWHI